MIASQRKVLFSFLFVCFSVVGADDGNVVVVAVVIVVIFIVFVRWFEESLGDRFR